MNSDKKKNQVLFFVSDSEKDIINKKMDLIGMTNISAYLRRMAIYGYMIEVDMSPLNELTKELSRIGNNVNQLAKRANETGNIYYDDIEKVSKDLAVIKMYLREFTHQISDEI